MRASKLAFSLFGLSSFSFVDNMVYYNISPVCVLALSLAPFTPVLDISVEGVRTVTYLRNCKIVLSGIDSIELLICLVIASEGTTNTNLSMRLIMALAIASFIENSDTSSGIHINPNLISGRDSEPGLNVQQT